MGNTTQPPQWAMDFIEDVLRFLHEEDGIDIFPEVTWRRSKTARTSSGRAWSNRIHITAGSSRLDAKLVILHEIAHVVLPDDEHHSDKFWEVAFSLYRHFGIPPKYAVEREAAYKANAVPVAKKLGYRIPKHLHHKLKTRTARRIKRQEVSV